METTDPKKIIIVEDSYQCSFIAQDIHNYVKPILVKTIVAQTYSEACDAYESHPDTCVMVVDISLDKEQSRTDIGKSQDGLTLIEEIRKVNTKINLIAFTASNYPDVKDRIKRANAVFINKHFLTDPTRELLDTVLKFLI